MSANDEHLMDMDPALLEISKLPDLPNDPMHTAWLVNRRSKIMGLLLVLVRYFEDEKNQKKVKNTWLSFSVLLGAGFSLWRAVFLAVPKTKKGKKGDDDIIGFEGARTDAKEFFKTLIRDNAIGFPQESGSREWSVGYYLNDAMFRLCWLRKTHGDEFNDPACQEIDKFYSNGIGGEYLEKRFDRQYIWDKLYLALYAAFDCFKEGKNRKSIAKHWKEVIAKHRKDVEEKNQK